MAIGNPSFDVFQLSDEHDELRAVLRDLCDKEIAPYAADVDEKARYTDEALAALNASGFSAIHIPEEYGGQGGDSVAACIVIEEVARVCASSSLIPICNKLGTMGMLLRGSEELKKQVLPSIGAGEATASYALSEREAGSDAAAMRTRAKADGDDWVLNGSKCWISNGGHSHVVHRDGGDRSRQGRQRHLGVRRARGRSGLHRRAQGEEDGHQGLAHHRVVLRGLPHSRRPHHRRAGHRVQDRAGHPRPHPPDDRRASRRHRAGRAGRGDRIHQGTQAVRQVDQRLPGRAVHARRHGDEDRGRPPDGLHARRRAPSAASPNLGFISSAAKCFASDVAMEVTTDAVQLFGGYGYTVDFPVERFMRDAKITQIYEGTNQIQRVVMSRALLR